MKKSIPITLLALALITANAVIAASTNPTLKVGELPDYPEPARIKNIQGTVVVEALVDESGKVFAADVVQSVHKDLDTAAVKAVLAWTFDPAMENGEPVMKVVQIPVDFNLVDPLGDSIRHSNDTAIARK